VFSLQVLHHMTLATFEDWFIGWELPHLCSQLGSGDSVFDSCLSYWGLVIHFCYTYLSSLMFRSKCMLGKPIQDMSVQESCDQSEVLKLTSRWRQEMTSSTLNPFHWRCLPSGHDLLLSWRWNQSSYIRGNTTAFSLKNQTHWFSNIVFQQLL